jgi:hypothetical protein
MKQLLLAAGLLVSAAPQALAQASGVSVPSYTAKSGAIYRTGDVINLVAGTMEGGIFKYVYVPANAWMGFPQQQLGAKWNGKHPVIKAIRQQPTTPAPGYHTVAVLSTSGLDACVDLEEAETAGEIERPIASVADELLKLKQLLDTGLLTQSEFDTQKAKLLGR